MNVINQASGNDWTLYCGDSVEVIKGIPDSSVDFSIYSPPFSNLYIYSNSVSDMGNAANHAEFFKHYEYLLTELHRITVPGRLVSVHCKDLPLYHGRDGAAGLYDFPGDCIQAHKRTGWTFHSRVTIWKDPVIEMQRTKNHGLLYKNFKVRGEVCRQGMADYVLTFRKWEGVDGTESTKPVEHRNTDFPLDVWQRWASPVWMDIDQTNTLNYLMAREGEDERHICPLQLDVIERCIALWSNPGDVVFSPFAGIGSEGVMALKAGRKFIGIELKESYFDWAAKHMGQADLESKQIALPMFATG